MRVALAQMLFRLAQVVRDRLPGHAPAEPGLVQPLGRDEMLDHRGGA
jgi:hypothetical protein